MMIDTPKKKKRPRRFRLTRKQFILIIAIFIMFLVACGIAYSQFIWYVQTNMYICTGLSIDAPCRNGLGTQSIDIEVDGTLTWITTTPEPQATETN